MGTANLFVLTGAPGAGKTAILDRIGAGIRRMGEPAREVLAEQRAVGGAGTYDRDPSLFVDLLLERSIDKHRDAQRWEGPVVFDRGVPDCVAYAVLLGTDPMAGLAACERYRYHSEVLVVEPWEEIYVTDGERTMSFADTIPFHVALVEAYERAGYSLLEVPRDSAEDRAIFVRDHITGR
jgi:predicted ATPase